MAIPEKIIDFHVHLFPDRMFDAIWNYFSSSYKWDVQYKMYYRDCIRHLNEHGVQKIVYSNYAHRPGVAEGLNEWNLKVLDENPGLYCFAAFHPGDKNALEAAEKVLDHPRVLGFKLQLLVQRFYPHDERLFPMYEMVMSRKKHLLFHAGTGPVGNEFVGLKEFRKVLDRYPELPATVAHMGAHEYGGFINLLDEHPNLYLDTAFAFLPGSEGLCGYDLGNALLEKNKNRILYGSDFPNLIMPREAEIQALAGLNLSQEFYNRVFFENGNALIQSIVLR